MSRRVSLPAADDLFRPTAPPDATADSEPSSPAETAEVAAASSAASSGESSGEAGHAPSGRVRHDEKMTIYVTADELLDIEHTRLMLRRSHGFAVDRGRLVREAVAIALEDYEKFGDDSVIVQRLMQP